MPPLVPCLEKPGLIERHPTVCVMVNRSMRRIVDIKTRELLQLCFYSCRNASIGSK